MCVAERIRCLDWRRLTATIIRPERQEGASEPIDLEDQRRCYQAFAEVWTGAAALRGVYFWNYYGWGGRISRGYTPRHKPAGQEIERYFQAESARPAL